MTVENPEEMPQDPAPEKAAETVPQGSVETKDGGGGKIPRLLAVFGIHCSRHADQWLRLSKRFFIIAAIITIFFSSLFGGFMVYSNQPGFCTSCHIMDSTYASWGESSHKEIACTKCHYPVGFFDTMRLKVANSTQLIKTVAGTAPAILHAEVDDSVCLRGGCHVMEELGSEGGFKGAYEFDHASHLEGPRRGLELSCTTCHSRVVHGDRIVTENVCFICHFKQGGAEGDALAAAACTVCHEVPAGEITVAEDTTFEHAPLLENKTPCLKCHSDSIRGTGEVPAQTCMACHPELDLLAERANSELMHAEHVATHAVKCFQCHAEISHGKDPQTPAQADSCSACHSSDHSAARQLFAGRGGLEIEGTASTHSLLNVDCIACHVPDAGHKPGDGISMLLHKANPTACEACHGKDMEGVLEDWLEERAELQAAAVKALAAAEQALAALPADHAQRAAAAVLLKRARHNAAFVAAGWGYHNTGYAAELLEKALEDAAEAARLCAAAN